MRILLSFAFLYFFLVSGLVLTLPTSDAVLQNLTKLLGSLTGPWELANSTSPFLLSEPVPDASLRYPNSVVWSCDGPRFGYQLDAYSCAKALGDMLFARGTATQRDWFNRDVDGVGVPLPQRYMSRKCPSLCHVNL